MLITVCFFTSCSPGGDSSPSDGSDQGGGNPDPPENVITCDFDPPEEDVFLRLDCPSTYMECKKEASIASDPEIATINNTIKTANLPYYAVCRKGSTDYELPVTLEWVVTAADGSGFGRGIGSSGMTVATIPATFTTPKILGNLDVTTYEAYDRYPRATPPPPLINSSIRAHCTPWSAPVFPLGVLVNCKVEIQGTIFQLLFIPLNSYIQTIQLWI